METPIPAHFQAMMQAARCEIVVQQRVLQAAANAAAQELKIEGKWALSADLKALVTEDKPNA